LKRSLAIFLFIALQYDSRILAITTFSTTLCNEIILFTDISNVFLGQTCVDSRLVDKYLMDHQSMRINSWA